MMMMMMMMMMIGLVPQATAAAQVPDWVKRAQFKNINTLLERDSRTSTAATAATPPSSITVSSGGARNRSSLPPASGKPATKLVTKSEYQRVHRELALVKQQRSEFDAQQVDEQAKFAAATDTLQELEGLLSTMQTCFQDEIHQLWLHEPNVDTLASTITTAQESHKVRCAGWLVGWLVGV
mgnify:FL=1